jgi:hypothetical protein
MTAIPRRISPNLMTHRPQSDLVGGTHRTLCVATVRGDRLWVYRDDYKIALACVLSKDAVTPLDTPNMQVSSDYDISRGPIPMKAVVSKTLVPLPPFGENYLLPLVPNKVSSFSFRRCDRRGLWA